VSRGRFGVESRKGIGDVTGDDSGIGRIGEVMRIAGGMNVTFGAIERRWDFEQLYALAASDTPRSSRRQLGIARLIQQRREPADFKVCTALDQGVGAIELYDEARLCVDKMWVLGWLGQGRNRDFSAANRCGDRAKIRRRDNNI